MRTLIDTLHRLLAVPSVEGVAYFAPNGASYCARLDSQVSALEEIAPSINAWFREAGTEVRFLEMRARNRRFLWFRAGSGALFVAANPKAHAPSLASRIALSIVALVDGVAPDQLHTSHATSPAQALGTSGTPTIPAPLSEPVLEVRLVSIDPVVTFVGSVPDNAQVPAVDNEAAKQLVLVALNALSSSAALVLGGPVRRNYFNRARKQVAASGPLYAIEIDLDGRLRAETLPDLTIEDLAPQAATWCRKFIELVSVIEPNFSGTKLETLAEDEQGLLTKVGFLRGSSPRAEASR